MAKKGSIATVPTYTFEDTNNPNLKRFCDMSGDWTHYYLVKEKRYVKAVNHIIKLGHSKGPNFMDWLLRSTPEEVAKKLLEKGDEGSRTHQAIREMIEGSKVTMSTKYPTELHDGRQTILTNDEWENLQGFVKWCEKYQPRSVSTEYTLCADTFAGTMDALMVITVPAGDKDFEKEFWGKDVLILIDWKTSAAVWFEYEAQTSAYLHMVKQDKRFQPFLKAYEGRIFTGVVRLGTLHKTRYQFIVWDQKIAEGEHWDRFMAAQLMAKRYEPTFDPEIENIPIQLFIKVPKATVGGRKKKVQLKK